jgi:hypothetical protein
VSERTEVEVLLPLERQPTPDELKHLLEIAFGEAKRLVGPGRVLGVTKTLGAVHAETGKPALKVRFAVEAPELLQPHRNTHATS